MSRRSGRNQKVVLPDGEEAANGQEAISTSSLIPAKRASADNHTPKRPGPKRPRKASDFKTPYLFTNPKSCLVNADLLSAVNESTWELLTDEERSVCCSLLPDVDLQKQPNGSVSVRHGFFDHNIFLQDALREFQASLEAGYLRPSHLMEATNATRDRRNGKADKFKEEQFERYWGEKQSSQSNVVAGESAYIKLTSMFTLFKIGDIFKYSRTFRLKDLSITVEKECELVAMLESPDARTKRTMIFRVPAGAQKYLAPDSKECIVLEGIKTLSALETACLDLHGKLSRDSRPNGNSWTFFRLQRQSEDAGTLFDIRRAFVT